MSAVKNNIDQIEEKRHNLVQELKSKVDKIIKKLYKIQIKKQIQKAS